MNVELGVHLPLIDFRGEGLSLRRLQAAADAARDHDFAAVSANDHLLFQAPWLDGPTALSAVVDRTGEMELAFTVALAAVRGPVPLAKTLSAIDVLSDGRLIAGVGPGSSARDWDAVGQPFEERWKRFDEAVAILRALVRGGEPPPEPRYYALPDGDVLPAPARPDGIPIWIGSWGSEAGLRRVQRLGDGWLASSYNTDPDRFAAGREKLPAEFPSALATMWTWVTDDPAEAERVLGALATMLRREPAVLAGQVCVGSPEHCGALIAKYAEAGCSRIYFWPLGDEPEQIRRIAAAPA